MLLFANYKTIVVNDNGKSKVSGGKRVVYTTHHPCWDAKNRFGFPDEIAFDPAALAPELVTAIRENSPEKAESTKSAPVQTTPVSPAPVEKPAPVPAAVENLEKAEALRQIQTLMEMAGVSPEQLSAEVARRGVCPAGTPIEQYNLHAGMSVRIKKHHNLSD